MENCAAHGEKKSANGDSRPRAMRSERIPVLRLLCWALNRTAWSAAVLLIGLALPAYAAEAEPEAKKEAHHGKSADEVAKELANPNNALARLTFKNQFRWYKGDLPDADDRFNYTLLFQPVFPFPLEATAGGSKVSLFLRPAIPFAFEQPVPRVRNNRFSWHQVSAMGDIGFDLALGISEQSGLLWALGMVGTLPTATDNDVAGGQLRLGPEGLIAKFEKWGMYGVFPSHQWTATGWKDKYYSNTQVQWFMNFFPGNGWVVGTTPIMDYDWANDEWTVPLQLITSKTVQMGRTPVKLEFEFNYYVEQPDEFGPEFMLGFNVTPVVPNYINSAIRSLF